MTKIHLTDYDKNLPDKTIVTPHGYAAIVKIPIFADVFGLYFTYVYL